MTDEIDNLSIVKYPSPGLWEKCPSRMTTSASLLTSLAGKMLEIMHASEGLGLAAPQVGIQLRMFVWNATGDPADDMSVIDPVLADFDGKAFGVEGCLSLPGIVANVKRATSVALRGRAPDGSPVDLRGDGLVARIWQHENDHLDGILLLDHMCEPERVFNRAALKTLEDAV